MAQLDIEHAQNSMGSTRQRARQRARLAGHVHNAQLMLVAASLAAAGIVAVAATMMTTLL